MLSYIQYVVRWQHSGSAVYTLQQYTHQSCMQLLPQRTIGHAVRRLWNSTVRLWDMAVLGLGVLCMPLVAAGQIEGSGVDILTGNVEPNYCKEILQKDAGDEIFRCYNFYASLLSNTLIPNQTGEIESYPLLLDAQKESLPSEEGVSIVDTMKQDSLLEADAQELLRRVAQKRQERQFRRAGMVFHHQLTSVNEHAASLPLRLREQGFMHDAYTQELYLLDSSSLDWKAEALVSKKADQAKPPLLMKRTSSVSFTELQNLPVPDQANVEGIQRESVSLFPASVLYDQNAPSLKAKGTGLQVSECENATGFVFYLLNRSSFTCEKQIISQYDDQIISFDPVADFLGPDQGASRPLRVRPLEN